MDDWPVCAAAAAHGAPFSPTRFQHILAIDQARPSGVPVRFVLSSLLGAEPMLWHIASLANGILIVLLLGKMATLLNSGNHPGDRHTYWSVAACWLIIPWSVGFRFWPTLLPTQFLLLAFLFMTYWLFRCWTSGKSGIVLPSFVYLFVCLGYEAFYFQFIPVFLIGFVLVAAGKATKKDVLASGAGLVLAQGFAVGWYFFTQQEALAQRSISQNWMDALDTNLGALPRELLRSMQDADRHFVFLAAAAIIICAAILYKTISAEGGKSTRPALLMLAVVLCCAVGAVLSITAFTMGGRPVVGVGVETRVFSIFTAWFVLAAAVWGGYFWLQAKPAWRFALGTAAAGLGICLLAANFNRMEDWAAAWRDQQKILAEMPIDQMTSVPPESTVLYIHPLDVNGAPIFASAWDINHAVPLSHPTVRLHFVVYSPWGGPMTWNGTELAYDGQPALKEADRVHVWRPGTKSFYEASEPFRVNQNLSIERLPKAALGGADR